MASTFKWLHTENKVYQQFDKENEIHGNFGSEIRCIDSYPKL